MTPRNRHRSATRLPSIARGLCAALLCGTAACTGMDTPVLDDSPDPDAPADPGEPAPTKPTPADPDEDPIVPADPDGPPTYEEGKLLVRFRDSVDQSTSSAIHTRNRSHVMRTFRSLPNLQLIELPPGQDVEEAMELYGQDPRVLYAEPNYRVELLRTPNDPKIAELWGMNNKGQTSGLSGADINAFEAWDITTGSNDVILGITDTGVDYKHPDLAANMFVNPGEIAGNGVDDDENGYVDDIHGINVLNGTGDPMDDHDHGTHCAGTMAAVGDNGIGVAGVNWKAKVVACKAFDAETGSATNEDLLVCLDYFLALRTRSDHPVPIVATNNSWGDNEYSQAMYDAIEAHRQAGMLFVAAAGNDGGRNNDVRPQYPASYDLPNIISVMASDHNDQRAGFSNIGPLTVDVAAPGKDILSTVVGGGYELFDGTSMAAPHVTGLAGLIVAQNPSRDWRAIRNLILTTGAVTPASEHTSLSGRRIQAWGPNDDGALNCRNRVLTRRLAPERNNQIVVVGAPIELSLLALRCEAPFAQAPTVTVQPTGEVLTLVDATGLGVFSGQWSPPALGSFKLVFSTGDELSIRAIQNYAPAQEVPFEYRDLAQAGADIQTLPLNDDDSEPVLSPFPIRLSDLGEFSKVFVGSNGVVSLSRHITSFAARPLPIASADILIAPLWDDLNPGIGGEVSYAVLGQAPDRELVIEWRDVPRFPDVGKASFQIVFFEGRTDILFNYLDVVFDDIRYDHGAAAIVGLQLSPDVARQQDVSATPLADSTSLLWRLAP